MNDVERALSQIADIRSQLAASTQFRGIAPEVNALTAFLSLAVAVAQTLWPEALARDGVRFVAVWAAASMASIIIVGVEAISRARRLHGRMANAMLGAALRQVVPFIAASFIIAMVICKFSAGNAWLIPGLWQILIGLLGFSVLQSLPYAMVWVAGWYFCCGAIVLILAGWSGSLSPWMMGLPFALGQGFVALILHQANGERDDQA